MVLYQAIWQTPEHKMHSTVCFHVGETGHHASLLNLEQRSAKASQYIQSSLAAEKECNINLRRSVSKARKFLPDRQGHRFPVRNPRILQSLLVSTFDSSWNQINTEGQIIRKGLKTRIGGIRAWPQLGEARSLWNESTAKETVGRWGWEDGERGERKERWEKMAEGEEIKVNVRSRACVV